MRPNWTNFTGGWTRISWESELCFHLDLSCVLLARRKDSFLWHIDNMMFITMKINEHLTLGWRMPAPLIFWGTYETMCKDSLRVTGFHFNDKIIKEYWILNFAEALKHKHTKDFHFWSGLIAKQMLVIFEMMFLCISMACYLMPRYSCLLFSTSGNGPG